MVGNPDLSHHLDNLRTALAQGMAHWVGGLVKAALIAGCTKNQLMKAAAEVGSQSAREAVRRALDEWGWIEARRKSVTAELTVAPGYNPIL